MLRANVDEEALLAIKLCVFMCLKHWICNWDVLFRHTLCVHAFYILTFGVRFIHVTLSYGSHTKCEWHTICVQILGNYAVQLHCGFKLRVWRCILKWTYEPEFPCLLKQLAKKGWTHWEYYYNQSRPIIQL
jgi:hypothetical protein